MSLPDGAKTAVPESTPPSDASITPLVKTCPEGYELVKDKDTGEYDCQCKKYHLYWPIDGACYREFAQGPCPTGHR